MKRIYGFNFETEEQAEEFEKIYIDHHDVIDKAVLSKQRDTFDGCVRIGAFLNVVVVTGFVVCWKIFKK